MSEKKDASLLEASNELVRWLQLLVLPLWARAGLMIIMGLIVAGGLALLTFGIFLRKQEDIAAAITMLTVALPVMLVVVALVFGQNGEKRLTANTVALLDNEIPQALQANLSSAQTSVVLTKCLLGCRADYSLSFIGVGSSTSVKIDFSVELNVRKVNLAFWLNDYTFPDKISIETPSMKPFRHVISGAVAEGYRMNDTPASYFGSGKGHGILFFRELDPDFLIKPAARLYFCQDLSFFVRGVIEAVCEAGLRTSLQSESALHE